MKNIKLFLKNLKEIKRSFSEELKFHTRLALIEVVDSLSGFRSNFFISPDADAAFEYGSPQNRSYEGKKQKTGGNLDIHAEKVTEYVINIKYKDGLVRAWPVRRELVEATFPEGLALATLFELLDNPDTYGLERYDMLGNEAVSFDSFNATIEDGTVIKVSSAEHLN